MTPRNQSFDLTLRVRLRHRSGELARLATAIAEASAVIGDIATEHLSASDSVRLLTVEATDEAHSLRVLEVIRGLPDVDVLDVVDRVIALHRGGKIRTVARAEISTLADLRSVYTPGVARISKMIADDKNVAWQLTGLGTSVGIFTTGSRVLGLGDIGPLASLPVMEGKAMLYAQLAGLSATPILIDEQDPEEVVRLIERVSIGFGAIHLEDIRTPDCFYIEGELIRRLAKPVFHDDQHGTATAALAAIMGACRRTGTDPRSAVLGQIGLGAAGSAIARLAKAFGIERVMVTDPNSAVLATAGAWGGEPSSLEEIMAKATIVVATTGRAGLISPKLVRKGQIVFALSNPDPEISADDALASGAAFAGDGRSVNNALAYPGIIRAALQARVRYITPNMLIAAAKAISMCTRADEIVPSPLDLRVHTAVTAAVAEMAGTDRISL